MQTEIALRSTESEYTELSYALHETIPMMELLKEMKSIGLLVTPANADIHCQVFKDNSGAMEMAQVHKYCPRTKHLNIKLHHFCMYVEQKEMSLHPIKLSDQIADYLTKPLNVDQSTRLRRQVLGS